ncbi:MAG TPA: TIGR00266 family protein [Candidatus Fimimorpha faecalis]|uniref:TIGR00266 family protein n=1 Tax=Candidatus Fimimorpha faecalis TaxID=2840824 RepID=A0A9D1EH04_9FIRM|nr:TIGR00266 family protein [Candidatus Fimimorpha faecalis]
MRYEIKGEPLPVVVCKLEEGEKMITERGSMSWMSPNMKMETSGGGSIGKAFGRLISGEAIFQNIYTAQGGPGLIAFASSFPGSIRTIEISPGNDFIVQKTGFLASESGVELSVFFRKKLGSGFFGGEGFIMQRLSGNGLAFIEIDGSAVEYELEAGQQIVVDTGYLAAMSSTCSMDIQTIPGVKNMFFGGEGVFNTVVTGPGRVILQTMPVSGVAKAIQPFIITKSQN